jgi:hypothetical protein
MTQANGHDQEALDKVEATVADDIKELAGRIREHQGLSVVERVSDNGVPFDQKTHTLMMESVDRITQQWVGELNHVRDNTKTVEQMVIAQAAKAKDELTKLHLLGTQAMKEAQRGQEVVQHLGDELDAMMMEHGGTH